jgi:hypothetical protein
LRGCLRAVLGVFVAVLEGVPRGLGDVLRVRNGAG